MSYRGLLIGLGLSLLGMAGGCRTVESAPKQPAVAESTGTAEDRAAFDAFIASRPTPEVFRARYPAIKLVLPGDISTRELRMDRSRYFADLDEQQRIRGGRFQ